MGKLKIFRLGGNIKSSKIQPENDLLIGGNIKEEKNDEKRDVEELKKLTFKEKPNVRRVQMSNIRLII